MSGKKIFKIILIWTLTNSLFSKPVERLRLTDQGYFELPGFNVMVFDDFYPEGHQGGVTLIQNGTRLAANGDVRLSVTPGQWDPLPKIQSRTVRQEAEAIDVEMSFPDSSRMEKGFNPLPDPGIYFKYRIRVYAQNQSVFIQVDLERPLPMAWLGKIGFHLELFPGAFFDKAYLMDQKSGLFPRQFTGAIVRTPDGDCLPEPLATGQKLTLTPESAESQMTIQSLTGTLELTDGRAKHNNGWFIIREAFAKGATEKAILWEITPTLNSDWQYKPVIQISQIGYHPVQEKKALIELDRNDSTICNASLYRFNLDGSKTCVLESIPQNPKHFLRYQYREFDFSTVRQNGLYQIVYGEATSSPFKIDENIYDRGVWQPTLTYYLPVQMCHMRVNDRYRVWHDLCHMDDALMAPVNHTHFDGYSQGASTLCPFEPFEHVPGLNRGGWHDAGDYDLRVESQSGTVFTLALIYELFHVELDQTTIDQSTHLVEISQPDGKPDVLQQIEHGVIAILSGYQSLGRLYRGIIASDIRQYVLLGDGRAMTDNQIGSAPAYYQATGKASEISADDRWVFTEENPYRELTVITGLAAASRVLWGYNDTLSVQCLDAALSIWSQYEFDEKLNPIKIAPLCELLITTHNPRFEEQLTALLPLPEKSFSRTGGALARVYPFLKNKTLKQEINQLAEKNSLELTEESGNTPYGVPYHPHIWGAGWNIQRAGVDHYFLHKTWPEYYNTSYFMNALLFVLGRHPGENNASFVSGVGANSVTTAYGVNRADWSYIPGGVVSGTALIRPDLPELKVWPYFWQQTEYVMGGGATHFMFLVLAAQETYQKQ